MDHGGLPAPANDAAGTAEPIAPVLSEPKIPEPSPPEARPAPPPEPVLPVADPPFVAPVRPPEPKPEAQAEPREAAIAITSPRPGPAQTIVPEEPEAPGLGPVPDAAELAPASTELGNGRQRPRIEVVPPRTGRSRMLRNVFVGGVLAVVIGLIAVAAFMLRDRPQILPANGTEAADPQQADGETKFSDRIGGDAGAAPKAAPRPEGGAPPRAAGSPADPAIAVAQRAELIEEASGADNGQPVASAGRVTWRLDTVNGEQGQPLQNAVVATVTVPNAGLTLVMTIQRNLDATLPASHTVSLAFSQSGANTDPVRTVQDVGLLQAKDEQSARGSPVSGLPVRVRDNLFLIGLSSLQNDVERNTDLLLHKTWFDLALRYTSGRRAVLTFEKGAAGTQVMQSAFDAWQ